MAMVVEVGCSKQAAFSVYGMKAVRNHIMVLAPSESISERTAGPAIWLAVCSYIFFLPNRITGPFNEAAKCLAIS